MNLLDVMTRAAARAAVEAAEDLHALRPTDPPEVQVALAKRYVLAALARNALIQARVRTRHHELLRQHLEDDVARAIGEAVPA